MADLVPEDPEHLQIRVKNHLKIAEKVRTGEYFREALSIYNVKINDPMTERYFYIAISGCALAIFLAAYLAVQGLYPLHTDVPLIYITHDIIDDQPFVMPLRRNKEEKASEAMLRYLVKNYVSLREEYDISTIDRNMNGIKSQTIESEYKKVEELEDPHNPESPITMYQRHSTRRINILRTRRYTDSMEVTYEAIVDGKNDVKKSQWRANVSFTYSGIEPDEKSGKLKPVEFMVTDYQTKRLQD